MSVEPTSAEIYEQLRRESSPKFVASLEKIKGACDALAAANAPLSYSRVGKMAEQLYGGPKTQSIMNSLKHKCYIDARQRERISGPNRSTAPSGAAPRDAAYPTSDLDYKTRRYIDDLRQRNSMLEAAMRELKLQVLTATEVRPIDLAGMISAGPQEDSSMVIQQTTSPTLPAEFKETLMQLLDDLVHRVPGVEPFKDIGIRLRTGEWLLSPERFALLKSFAEFS